VTDTLTSAPLGKYRQPTAGTRARPLRHFVLSFATATACVVTIGAVRWTRNATFSTKLFNDMWSQWRAQVFLPWFFAFVLLLWVLQWRYPGRRDERMVHPGVAQDLAWFLLSPMLAVTVIGAYLVAVGSGVTAVFGHWDLNLVPQLGAWRVAVMALVISDFFGWLSHWMHHRIATLWQFHAVHHSQNRMNVLSDNRQHVVETMVSATIAFLPAWFLGLNTGLASALAISTVYVSAFIHTNIRTNLGPLRYIFISPQAHRVHHSIEPQYYDKNFGTLFSWWDYLFGTHYPGDDEYPPTGVYDPDFPMETSTNPARVARTWTAQTLYPFRVLAARS
jgi:sterol desaturase/sphingolipid hydroxylase (fatty acid hydroxylase superfamily)